MLKSKFILLLGLVAYTRAAADDTMEGFIVGGDYALIEKHPHSVMLEVDCVLSSGKRIIWICGASILNQRILLSAAHCLHGCTYKSYIGINLGHENRNKSQSFSAYSFWIHEKYTIPTSGYDICLLKVNRVLKLDKKVGRVALMRKPPYNELAKVAGWGMVDQTRLTASDRLKFIAQKVIVRNECVKHGYVPEGTLCAFGDINGDYASRGDSGSALVVRGYIQIGLVSYKIPALFKTFVIYTDVGHYYSWIKKESKRLYCE